MAGQKFQYDESGSTFLYFLISFLGLVLFPCTFYFWPAEKPPPVLEETKKKVDVCRCRGCLKKEIRLEKPEKWKGLKKNLQRLLLCIGWAFMAFFIYKVQEFDYEYANFDPYEILGVGTQASQGDIKKAYRKLSLVLHPDKPTGDERKFMKLNKAYQALTDDVSRRNYELYGNPDGPGPMNFGIALPSWIVEKENSLWVLGLYGLVFMIGLPTVVAIWWYRSSKFSNDQVLIDTTQLYYYFFHKTPQMIFKRALMILAASLEFEKSHNPEIVERPSDNYEIPFLIKHLSNLGEKNKERPLCFPYSIKARALLYAHLLRMELNEATLDIDRLYIVKLCPTLINEMVSCVSQLIMLAHAGRISRLPSLDTIEAVMRLSQHIVQALNEGKNSFLQLPHVTDENLRYFISKKKPLKTIEQFVSLQTDERRGILRTLSDEQYNDVMRVCARMPQISMSVHYEVVDDVNTGVFTAGAIVTVTVCLDRRPQAELFGEKHIDIEGKPDLEVEEEKKNKTEQPKVSGWKPPPSRKTTKKKTTKQRTKKPDKETKETKEVKLQNEKVVKKETKKKEETKKENVSKLERVEDIEESDEDTSTSHSDESLADEADTESHREDKVDEDDDAEWEKFQKSLTKREKILEGKSKLSHSVHCPYYTDDKQEHWWVYICDRKKRMLITAPFLVTNLVDEEEVQLKFTAPHKMGMHVFQVCLKSDSYIGFDQSMDIKMDVKEAEEIPIAHPQWEEFSSEEEGDYGENALGQLGDESEFTTDEEISDSD